MLVGSGFLGAGEAQHYDVELKAGGEYRVYVHPEDPTVDFDLHIFDENGALISWDESNASDARGVMTPAWSGPFRIVVNSARGSSRYSVAVYT